MSRGGRGVRSSPRSELVREPRSLAARCSATLSASRPDIVGLDDATTALFCKQEGPCRYRCRDAGADVHWSKLMRTVMATRWTHDTATQHDRCIGHGWWSRHSD